MIILGLGFGDEGKGLVTSYLASKCDNPIVVRFNGGHQAGHTVVHNGYRHVFSSFNSATLNNATTYWSKFCTFYPEAFLNEYNALLKEVSKNGNEIKFYIHALSPVTTPFDILSNQMKEKSNQHGSVGVGFGATIARQEAYFNLYVQDLFYENIARQKLHNIATLYYNQAPIGSVDYVTKVKLVIDRFIEIVNKIKPLINLIKDGIDEFEILDQNHENVIFEGSQGILLDMDYGFFPNVTRSNTTSKNALTFLNEDSIIANRDNVEIYYVTRTYQTRHGNGYMSNTNLPFPKLLNNEYETNKAHTYQGEFRKTLLDIDLLNYAISCDNIHSYNLKKNLVITCVDQTSEDFDVTINGKIKRINVSELSKLLNCKFEKVFTSYGDDISKIKQLK